MCFAMLRAYGNFSPFFLFTFRFLMLYFLTKSSWTKRTCQPLILPDKRQGDDIVWVYSNKPVTVFAVWVGVGVVRREDESWRSSHIPTTGCLKDKKTKEELMRTMHIWAIFFWHFLTLSQLDSVVASKEFYSVFNRSAQHGKKCFDFFCCIW